MPDPSLLESVLTALRELGGYFVWRGSDGQEYIVTSRQEFDARTRLARDTQLGLLDRARAADAPGALPAGRQGWTADDMLEKINRDLALYQLQQQEELEEEVEEVEDVLDENGDQLPLAPIAGKHVRFEPLRGDLPPSLQE